MKTTDKIRLDNAFSKFKKFSIGFVSYFLMNLELRESRITLKQALKKEFMIEKFL